jgi:S1-C subfamily serine protease
LTAVTVGEELMTMERARRGLLVLAVAAVLAAAACTSSSTPGGGSSPGNALQDDYTSTVDAVLPSVVSIAAGSSIGSGVVYDRSGDIVTNAHVVGDEHAFTVTLATDPAALPATLVASFPVGDVAVIRLTDPPTDLRPAAFADSSKLAIGQIVLAMGNPLWLASSVTQGIVSALGRAVSEPPSAHAPSGLRIPDMVQTSAAINPGNSGGALVSLGHQVVGINTLAATDASGSGAAAQGIGFAIPSDRVTRLAEQMIKDGRVVDSGLASLGLVPRSVLTTAGQPSGAGVVSVTAGGPAEQAGVQAGDVITRLGGTDIRNAESLSAALTTMEPGQRTEVTYLREGRSATADVTLGTL